MKDQNTIQPCRLRLHRRAPDPDTLTLLDLDLDLNPDLDPPLTWLAIHGSLMWAPRQSCRSPHSSEMLRRPRHRAAHSISPSGGREGRDSVAHAQVLRHLTVAPGSRQTTALPAVALSCATMGELLISRVKLGVEVCSVRQPRQPHVIPQTVAQARMMLDLSSS